MKLALIFGFIAVTLAYPRGGVITKSAYTGGYGVITKGVITHESILDSTKCNGPQCSGGCCPESAYVCCESGSFCASTLEECPQYPEGRGVITKGVIPNDGSIKVVNTRGVITKGVITPYPDEKLVKKLDLTREDCQGTNCPEGCCYGVYDYFCCGMLWDGGNQWSCAISPEYC